MSCLLTILALTSLALSTPLVERAPKLATIYDHCTTPNTIALTFDDGPYIWDGTLVGHLNAAGVKATFFVNGDNYQCIYSDPMVSIIKKAYASGHQIASHTWGHLDLATLDRAELTTEFALTDTALLKIIGRKPAFMRPPFGSYNNLVRQVAASRNQSMVLWDFDSGDSIGSTVAGSEAAYDQLIASKPTNVLTLHHETIDSTVHEMIPYAIKQIKAKLPGYQFVTVAECLGGKQAYHSEGRASARDYTWTC